MRPGGDRFVHIKTERIDPILYCTVCYGGETNVYYKVPKKVRSKIKSQNQLERNLLMIKLTIQQMKATLKMMLR